MNCLEKFIFVTLLSLLLFIAPVVAQDELPAILDYYPNCAYQIIDNAKVKVTTEQPFADKTRLSLLKKLRRKAKSLGADNLLLIDKKVKIDKNRAATHGFASPKVASYTVSYQAELISQCKVNNNKDQKLAPYDHHGYKVININTATTTIETTYSFTPPIKEKLNHPLIVNKELSLANGLYGINIGTSYQQVVDKLGDPSVELFMFKGERVIGYGRNHWLHFRSGRLVNIQSEMSILSPTFLNKIPLRDFFDDTPWVIANQIMHRSLLSKAKSALVGDMQLSSKKEIVISDQNNSLILYFSASKSHASGDITYILDDFSLQENSYITSSYQMDNRRKTQFDILGGALSKLNQEQVIDFQSLTSKLEQPIGRITLSVNSYIDIYNSNLLVEVKNSELVSIQLLEELFNLDNYYPKKEPWSLGDFVQGKSITELNRFFPDDIYELGNAVQIDSDEFQLTLWFDDYDGKNMLYEAKVTIY
ncbi:hypothetical protein [Colwellia sp. TT2012]|uniref:hypothetical protein n=1 Tax=Colwellia sp. TT2012 TaxID=1720342 RepID=UPI00070900B5|nr:hypothetical protein [Colwellia sp. TT2012]